MLKPLILAAAGSSTAKRAVTHAPVTSAVVSRFVAGEDVAAAVRAVQRLRLDGLAVSLDRLGEDVTSDAGARAAVAGYAELIAELAAAGLAAGADFSVKLSALGQDLDPARCLDAAREICRCAREVGATVTVDMEDHTRTDATLAAVHELRREFPDVGAVVQAYLRRTVEDCRALAATGSRVRLCKGAYREPAGVAFHKRAEVDLSYARCLRVLMDGPGYPMVATHDPRLVELAGAAARRAGRPAGSYEYQMLYGVRPDEQRRLSGAGQTVRVYVPYGTDWYGYLMRRLAERPANLTFFLRSLVSTS